MHENLNYQDAKEQLKFALLCHGLDVIQGILDYRIKPGEDHEVLNDRLNTALDQMSLNEFWSLYDKYVA